MRVDPHFVCSERHTHQILSGRWKAGVLHLSGSNRCGARRYDRPPDDDTLRRLSSVRSVWTKAEGATSSKPKITIADIVERLNG